MQKKKATPKSSPKQPYISRINDNTFTQSEIRARVDRALKEITAPSKRRILQFLLQKPKARTDEIARECAVGYPPARIHELNHEVLWRFGIELKCSPPKTMVRNRFGAHCNVQCWRIEIISMSETANGANTREG
jgi:hypothetical protein